MTQTTLIICGIGVLALGTFLTRLMGFRIGMRLALSERHQNLLSDAAIILLLTVAAISAVFEAQHFAGFARLSGVFLAVLLAWRKAPLIVIIVGAAVLTAGLRYAGIT